MKTLISSRLILRPLRSGDIPFLTTLMGSEERTRYLFGGAVMNPEQVMAFIAQRFTAEDAPTGLGILTARRPERLIGFAGIIPTGCLGEQDVEFGFTLSQPFERSGFATEIGCCQMQYAFDTLGLDRVLALAHPENKASVHVLRNKLKMTLMSYVEGTTQRGPRLVFCRKKADGLPAPCFQKHD